MEQGRREEDHHLRRMKPPPTQSESQPHQQPPPPPPQKCPRCDSLNTKFCYYNNYSLTQPRYFCKTCRRYWTQGGTLRNVPVGGGCRKAKRTKPSGSSSAGGDNSRSQPPLSLQPPLGNLGMPPMTMSGSYYSGGGFLSSLAAMNNLSQTQPFHVGGSSSGFSLLQGFNLSSLSSQQPQNLRQNEFYQMGGQSLVQPNRPLGSWNQTPINNNGSPNSNPNAGISLEPNQLPDFPGYGPPAS